VSGVRIPPCPNTIPPNLLELTPRKLGILENGFFPSLFARVFPSLFARVFPSLSRDKPIEGALFKKSPGKRLHSRISSEWTGRTVLEGASRGKTQAKREETPGN
jgi:hypothetical protein